MSKLYFQKKLPRKHTEKTCTSMMFFTPPASCSSGKGSRKIWSECTATMFTNLPFIMNITYLIIIIREKPNTAWRIVIDHNDIHKGSEILATGDSINYLLILKSQQRNIKHLAWPTENIKHFSVPDTCTDIIQNSSSQGETRFSWNNPQYSEINSKTRILPLLNKAYSDAQLWCPESHVIWPGSFMICCA